MAALREKEIPMGGIIGGLHGMQNGGRIDVPDAFCHRLGLGEAHGRGQCFQLAVDVGNRDSIAVHQRQFSDTGTGQTLGCIATDAAKTKEDDMGTGQTAASLAAPKHLIAGKTLIHRVHLLCVKKGAGLLAGSLAVCCN